MNYHLGKFRSAINLIPAMVLGLPQVFADVVLVPGHIEGTVTVGGETIVSMNVSASSAGDNAQQFLSPGVPSAAYDLTVNVPQGTMPTYSVQASSVRTRDSTTSPYDHDYLSFPSQSAMVSESAPAVVDFSLSDPNYVAGTVALTGSGALDRVSVHAYPTVGNGFSHYTDQYADSSTANALDFEFPVSGGDMRCSGTAYLRNGARINLSDQSVSPVAGVVTCDWTIETPATGQIEGLIEFSGADQPNRFDVRSGGPSNRSWSMNAPSNPESYSLDELPVGSYYPTAEAYLSNSDDFFFFPYAAFKPGRNTTIEAGDVDVIDITACQAYIEGNIGLAGAAHWDDVNFSEFVVGGKRDGGPAYGGYAYDRVTAPTATSTWSSARGIGLRRV